MTTRVSRPSLIALAVSLSALSGGVTQAAEEMDHSAMGHGAMKHSAFKPTWVSPHPSKDLVYVAGNGADEVLEIDTKTWKATRKFKTDKGPYNIDLSPDGKYMVVSYKSAAKTGIWNLETGETDKTTPFFSEDHNDGLR